MGLNNDGKVDVDEFVAHAKLVALDENKDGKIDEGEARAVGITEQQLKAMDTNEDGGVDVHDLLDHHKQHHKKVLDSHEGVIQVVGGTIDKKIYLRSVVG